MFESELEFEYCLEREPTLERLVGAPLKELRKNRFKRGYYKAALKRSD